MKEIFREVEIEDEARGGPLPPRAQAPAHRPRLAGAARRRDGRLLRHADAAQPGRQPLGGRRHACSWPSPTTRSQIAAIERAIRKADLGLNPSQRRQGDPHPGAAAHRGAPQGAGQEGARHGRARPHRRPPGAPRRQRQAQEDEKDTRSRRTTSAAASTRSRSSTTTTSPTSTKTLEHKEKDILTV